MHTPLDQLAHTSHPLPHGGEVIVLETGATITAEASAMLQALHSRSTGGLRAHLETLAAKGAEKFMASFYVGYGHDSIGDCGNTVIFVEGVSMLAAKAVQDWRLYSGQEASTRYIDFGTQRFENPLGSQAGTDILEAWRAFYVAAMPILVDDLKQRFAQGPEEKDSIYNKAINARAFDILRGFLPAGATTNLAWSTNLRQAKDKLQIMRHHPCQEMQTIATAIDAALQQAHPSSFGHKRYEQTEAYNASWSATDTYFHTGDHPDFALVSDHIDRDLLPRNILASRPAKTELPKFLDEAGSLRFDFTLDFGSFRDLQRHRSIAQRMPLLTMDLGFEDWYLDELPDSLRSQARQLLDQQAAAIAALDTDPYTRQYYIPMGYKTANRLVGSLPALVYLVELRATRFVHPTLRRRAIQMAQQLEQSLADAGLVLHLDNDPDRFDAKRGEHDIIVK